ncbi:uncharacterized protein LOC142572890 isoform X1 [Dermacentor variabilis]|uniref:uncharacterized protein LOC142572890 isoform X1 n=1 Tax=Dermacentor variabilis TaxID=34621 RepID=UPI003F5C6DEA
MKSALLIIVLALAVAAPCIAYPTSETKEKDAEEDSLKQDGRALETLGKILQGKDTTTEGRAALAELASQLGDFHGTDTQLDENASEYFFKKIRRVVENVAKVVVVNKVAGAVGGMIG